MARPQPDPNAALRFNSLLLYSSSGPDLKPSFNAAGFRKNPSLYKPVTIQTGTSTTIGPSKLIQAERNRQMRVQQMQSGLRDQIYNRYLSRSR